MLPVLQGVLLVLVALGGLGIVLTRDPLRQTVMVSLYGVLLALLFVVFQAPDVALSAIAVGTVVLPLMILLALAKIREQGVSRAMQDAGLRERSS